MVRRARPAFCSLLSAALAACVVTPRDGNELIVQQYPTVQFSGWAWSEGSEIDVQVFNHCWGDWQDLAHTHSTDFTITWDGATGYYWSVDVPFSRWSEWDSWDEASGDSWMCWYSTNGYWFGVVTEQARFRTLENGGALFTFTDESYDCYTDTVQAGTHPYDAYLVCPQPWPNTEVKLDAAFDRPPQACVDLCADALAIDALAVSAEEGLYYGVGYTFPWAAPDFVTASDALDSARVLLAHTWYCDPTEDDFSFAGPWYAAARADVAVAMEAILLLYNEYGQASLLDAYDDLAAIAAELDGAAGQLAASCSAAP